MGDVAIAYSDYESPDALFPDASFEGYAQRTKADLADFQDGLRVTHEGDQPSHNTLVGHSYGSTLVGETASFDWLPFTDDDHWFGENSADPQLGGNTMPVDPNAEHGGYWDDPRTRESMARIMTGEGNAPPTSAYARLR